MKTGKKLLLTLAAVASAVCCLFGFAACGEEPPAEPEEVYLVSSLSYNNVVVNTEYDNLGNVMCFYIDLYHADEQLPREDCKREIVGKYSKSPFSEKGAYISSSDFDYEFFEKDMGGYTRNDSYGVCTLILYYKDISLTLNLRYYLISNNPNLYLFDTEEGKAAFYRDTGITPPDSPDNPDNPPEEPDEPLPSEVQFTTAALSFGSEQSGSVAELKGLKYTFSVSSPALAEFRISSSAELAVRIYNQSGDELISAPEEDNFSELLPSGSYYLTVTAKDKSEGSVALKSFLAQPASFNENTAQISFPADAAERVVRFTPPSTGNYRFTTSGYYAFTVYNGSCDIVGEVQPSAAGHVVKFENTSAYYLVFSRNSVSTERNDAVTYTKSSDLANSNPDAPEAISFGSFTANIDAQDTTLYYSFRLSSPAIVQVKAYPDDLERTQKPRVSVSAVEGNASLSVWWRADDCAHGADYLPAGEYRLTVSGGIGSYLIEINDPTANAQYVSNDQKFTLSASGSTEIYWFKYTYYESSSGLGRDDNSIHLYLDASNGKADGFYSYSAKYSVSLFTMDDGWQADSSGGQTHSSSFSVYFQSTSITSSQYRAGLFSNGRTPLVSGRTYYVCFKFTPEANGSAPFWLTNTML